MYTMLQVSKSCEKVRLFWGKGETFSFLQDQEFLSIAKENMIWKMWLVNEFNRRSSYFKWMKKLVCQMSTFCQTLSTAVLMLIQNVYLVYNFCPFWFGNRKVTNGLILYLIYFRKSVTTLMTIASMIIFLRTKIFSWNIFLYNIFEQTIISCSVQISLEELPWKKVRDACHECTAVHCWGGI